MSDPLDRLESALALDRDGLLARPLELFDAIGPAAMVRGPRLETLWRRLFLESPLPYWHVARWALALDDAKLAASLSGAELSRWDSLCDGNSSRAVVLDEVARRFDAFDPDLFPWAGREEEPLPRRKYLLGRELARCYVRAAIFDEGPSSRAAVLLAHQEAWREWIDAAAPVDPETIALACAIAHDALARRRYTAGVYGVGKAHLLLEEKANHGPAAAVITAELVPLPGSLAAIDGLVVPDLRALGVVQLHDDFLQGVLRAWRLCRTRYAGSGPMLLSFAVRPSRATVIDDISGRSAETAVMAAIDSLFRGRMLRPNAAASASLGSPDPAFPNADLTVEPVSFEQKKYSAAMIERLKTVVVHPDVATEWRRQSAHSTGRGAGPTVVPGELFRRDALPLLETRSLWKLAILAPLGVAAAFTVLALFWQLYKASSSPPEAAIAVLGVRAPWVSPLLLASELVCLFMCLYITAYCARSIRMSLDSWRSAMIALGVSATIVLVAQLSPVGVRYEGLLDNPYSSVLFGEPQVTAQVVSQSGGGGFLALHAVAQTVGFITILYGVAAIVLRLIQTRALGEPLYEDRCELVRKDWRFSVAIFWAFVVVLLLFGLVRNSLWYVYLTTLGGVELIVRDAGWAEVVAPLCGVTIVLLLSVAVVWLTVIGLYLSRVVAASHGRAGYTAEDVVQRLPWGARLILRLRSAD